MPTAILSRPRTKTLQRTEKKKREFALYSPLQFSAIDAIAKEFADHIESHFEEIANVLLAYESFEVVKDETARTLDLLRHLSENKKYFVLRIGAVTSFLPRNQPLYALTCFVIVPALMASEVHFRIPHCMRFYFPELLKVLDFHRFFPNIVVSTMERLEFLRERSALLMDPETQQTLPVSDAVIFTGTSQHAERLRLVFDRRILFIANGSGHNPVLIAPDADISKAVEAVLMLQLYNQGQDCAAPNAILIHSRVFDRFLTALRTELQKVSVGYYRDRSCRVGPISDPDDLVRIQQLLVENSKWIDPSTPGVIRASDAIVQPTIICRPLKEGGNFNEVFAPIFFLQKYEDDKNLAQYFEDPHYARNAMYVSLFGTSEYLQNLIGRPIGGKVLHSRASILVNTHPHAPQVERGTQPYGGFGYGSSSISIHGKIVSKPTLPQRDIYEHLVRPLIRRGKTEEHMDLLQRAKNPIRKDVRKILGLKAIEETTAQQPVLATTSICYVDASKVTGKQKRYVPLGMDQMLFLLRQPNVEHIASMEPNHLRQIRALRSFLQRKKKMDSDTFKQWLYALPKKLGASEVENKSRQLAFFRHLYQLLLGQHSGPPLAPFILDADRIRVCKLLDV
ncbi:MAG TPA: aldehyde dehydrogenase family protein [Candidatus Nanoarchaeia archaeon]|nr:aldehyde dehydrogenase family protein [Candidatus Nanoarchaeia archaeon]